MATIVPAPIIIDDQGVPYIDGTNMKVVELVGIWAARGLTPEQLQEELPHLSLEQVYAALSYYHGHREELDADIRRRRQLVERIREETGEHPHTERLRAMLAERP
jgi:uncharacterized protein (DUF433 family)